MRQNVVSRLPRVPRAALLLSRAGGRAAARTVCPVLTSAAAQGLARASGLAAAGAQRARPPTRPPSAVRTPWEPAAYRCYATGMPEPGERPNVKQKRPFKARSETLLRRGFLFDVVTTVLLFGSGGWFMWWAKGRSTPKGPEPEKNDDTVIFVLGGPGAGKGTQCAKLVEDFGFVHLSAGDLLRVEQDRPESEYGEMIKTYIRDGKIVPMEVTIALLQNAMKASGAHRFLIDGFPRAMDQARKFEEQVCPGRVVLYFECPEDVMLKRLLKRGESSGRSDDNVESIRKRFKTFAEVSMPVINHYAAENKIIIISCLSNPEKVYEETKRAIAEIV